jgi:tetratricopeptide (TPR) repeat protein
MKTILLFINILLLANLFGQNMTVRDKAPEIIIEKEDTVKAKHLNDLSWNAIYEGNYDSAFFYIQKSLAISSKIGYKKGIASCYNTMGSISYHRGDLNQSISYYTFALKILIELNHKKGMAMVMTGMGLAFEKKGDLTKAMDYNLKALKIQEEIHDSIGIASTCNSLGMIKREEKDFEGANNYYNKALTIFKNFGDTMRMGTTLSNMGAMYKVQRNFERALGYYYESLRLEEKINDRSGIANAYTNIGSVYLDMDKWEEALDAEFKSLKIYEELTDKEGTIPCLLNIGNVYHNQNKDKQAIEYVVKGIKQANDIGALYYVQEGESLLSNIYLKGGNYKEGHRHYVKYIEIRDSLYNNEKAKQLVRAEMNYEFEKKETAARLEQLKKEAVAQAVHKKQQVIIWAVSALFLLAIIISILIVRQNKFRAEQRSMQLEQQLLRSQMNPHFIFNSLIAIESFIYKNEPKEAGKYLSGFARLMRLILENSREEFVPLEKEILTLENYLKLQKLRYDDAFDYSINVEEHIDSAMIEIPPMLAQPFIENAIEHGLKGLDKKGNITINFFLKNEDLVFEVLDNGVGFESTKTLNSKGDGHRSLAIAITQDRLKNLNKKNRNIKVMMEDIKDRDNRIAGAKVTFVVPYTKA